MPIPHDTPVEPADLIWALSGLCGANRIAFEPRNRQRKKGRFPGLRFVDIAPHRDHAVLAHAHNVPFIVAAPSSTFDLGLATGSEIVIEERAATEVRTLQGVATAPAQVPVWNPAFDVTPPRYVAHWVTEHGLFVPAPG